MIFKGLTEPVSNVRPIHDRYLQQNARSQAQRLERKGIELDIGEEESPYVIEPAEDPVPREAPLPEREREEEIPA